MSLWFPASPALQEELITAEPDRFVRPEPSASGTFSTWLALFVDDPGTRVDWTEVGEILRQTYRTIAPHRLVAELDARRDG